MSCMHTNWVSKGRNDPVIDFAITAMDTSQHCNSPSSVSNRPVKTNALALTVDCIVLSSASFAAGQKIADYCSCEKHGLVHYARCVYPA